MYFRIWGETLQNDIAGHYDKRGIELMQKHHYQHSLRHEDKTRTGVLQVTEKYLREIRPGRETLLDLCCGIGANSLYPAQLGYQVLGVDLSPKSIEASRWLAQENGLSAQCKFQVGSAIEFLSQTQESFDVIQMYASLYYFDRLQMLELIRRRLKPGGRFICVETNGSQVIANFLRWIKNPIVKNRDQGSLKNLTKVSDLVVFEKVFPSTQFIYLDFLSLGALPFKKNNFLANFVYRIGALVDRFLFNTLKIRSLAFKIVSFSEL